MDSDKKNFEQEDQPINSAESFKKFLSFLPSENKTDLPNNEASAPIPKEPNKKKRRKNKIAASLDKFLESSPSKQSDTFGDPSLGVTKETEDVPEMSFHGRPQTEDNDILESKNEDFNVSQETSKSNNSTKKHKRIPLPTDDCTYKPQIDTISEKLAKEKRKGKPIWEHLYNLDREKKEKRDQLHLEHKMQEEDNSLKDCTFHPILKGGPSPTDSVYLKQEGNIYERSQAWKSHIEETIMKKQDMKEQEEEKSCAFHPEINKGSSVLLSQIPKPKGESKFLERQRIAQEARKEKEMLLRRDIGCNWVRKTTVPAEFALTPSGPKNKNAAWKVEEEKSNQKRELASSKSAVKDFRGSEEQIDFEKERNQLHKIIQDMKIQM